MDSAKPGLLSWSNAMMSNLKIILQIGLLLGAPSIRAQAQSLELGSPAPKLDVKSFVKGEPISEFEHGKNYVVEFWATWCGPCKTSIPHLTELQKKNPGVTFIGVSVWEQDQGDVKPFVDEMGDKMAYRVAIDLVSDKEKPNEGVMAKTWMSAAGQNGIPAAFIVDKEGKIAWIGHPMEMDKPLEKVIAGTWDVKQVKEQQRKAVEVRTKAKKVQSKISAALNAGDPQKLVDVIDEVVGVVPSMEMMYGPMKLTALIKLDAQDKALEYAEKLAKSDLSEQAEGLNGLAWAILDPDAGIKPNAKLIAFATETARRADEKAAGKDAAIAETLAKGYFDSGNAAKAVETQERAVRVAKGTPYERLIDEMRDRLEKYKKAVK
jgi:thiol-disulfide isomerase/thioredoxin